MTKYHFFSDVALNLSTMASYTQTQAWLTLHAARMEAES